MYLKYNKKKERNTKEKPRISCMQSKAESHLNSTSTRLYVSDSNRKVAKNTDVVASLKSPLLKIMGHESYRRWKQRFPTFRPTRFCVAIVNFALANHTRNRPVISMEMQNSVDLWKRDGRNLNKDESA